MHFTYHMHVQCGLDVVSIFHLFAYVLKPLLFRKCNVSIVDWMMPHDGKYFFSLFIVVCLLFRATKMSIVWIGLDFWVSSSIVFV